MPDFNSSSKWGTDDEMHSIEKKRGEKRKKNETPAFRYHTGSGEACSSISDAYRYWVRRFVAATATATKITQLERNIHHRSGTLKRLARTFSAVSEPIVDWKRQGRWSKIRKNVWPLLKRFKIWIPCTKMIQGLKFCKKQVKGSVECT